MAFDFWILIQIGFEMFPNFFFIGSNTKYTKILNIKIKHYITYGLYICLVAFILWDQFFITKFTNYRKIIPHLIKPQSISK
jgi:hypothetical protein